MFLLWKYKKEFQKKSEILGNTTFLQIPVKGEAKKDHD
jgi:hypothetical protein